MNQHKFLFKLAILSLCLLSCLLNMDCNAGDKRKSNGVEIINTTAGLKTGFYYLAKKGAPGIRIKKDHSDETYLLNPVPFVSVDQVEQAELKKTKAGAEDFHELCLQFSNEGLKMLKNGTRQAINEQIGIVVAGHLLYVITITQEITDQKMCTLLNGYSESEMHSMLVKVNNKE